MGYGMKYTKGGFPFKASPTKQKKKGFDYGNKEADYGQKRDFHKKFDYSGEPDPSHEPRVNPRWHKKEDMDQWYKEEEEETKRINP